VSWSGHTLSHIAAASGPWLPSASTSAERVDSLLWFITVLSAFFFVLVVGTMVVFAVKYRRRTPGQKTANIHGNRTVEIVWAAIPAVLLVIIFARGFHDYMDMAVPPGDSIEVRVTGQKWFWSFTYPKLGINSNELVVPVDRPVKLTMSSMDVIHSFYVPAFRLKRDVLPNRYTVMWFNPNQTGTFDIFCAEYCGTGHSVMLGQIKVLSDVEYRKWVDSGGGMSGEGMSSVDFGKQLFTRQGCATCHSVDGSKKTGPSLVGRFGNVESLIGGGTVTVDDNYLRESIMNPGAKVVVGYEPVMPTYAGKLKEEQTNALIDYIKSLGAKP